MSDRERRDGGNVRPEQDRKRGNRQVIAVAYCVVLVFLAMIGYLVRFMVQDSSEVINNPANKRQELLAKRVVRGDIVSSDGKVLATTETDKNGKEIATLCRINKRLTVHVARHTFGTTVTLANNVSLQNVSKMLGHSSTRMTQHYARVLDKNIMEDMQGVAKLIFK